MNRKTTTFGKPFRGRLTAMAASATFALLLAGYAPLGFAQSPAPENFSSPEKAARALVAAVKADDEQTMMKILGAGKALVTLEDQAQNKQEREQFVNKYQEMHRLVLEPDRTSVLYIGAENWPFPVPLVASNGTWHFDARTGMREVLYRRIGENETKAIEACHALAQGEEEQQSNLRGGAADNPVIALLQTSNDGPAKLQDKPVESDGYYFRVLRGANKSATDDGDTGVSFIAYPVEYRESGVMTFIVSDDDVVYQKDLGPTTGKLASTMTTFQPGSTWQKAE
ncbi:MAG: hypothetical protein JWN45_1289 [Acidobacteriaceae bacterium]|nr:hypothetical protein [Acidobacteriaceae bacterium]